MNKTDSSLAVVASIGCAIGAVLLILGAYVHFPYGYYTFLRVIVSGSAALAAWASWEKRTLLWAIPLALLGVLFNPLVPVYLKRAQWFPIDLCTAGILALWALLQIRSEWNRN